MIPVIFTDIPERIVVLSARSISLAGLDRRRRGLWLLLPLLQCVDRIAQRLDRLIDLVLTVCRGCFRQQSLRRADGLLQHLDRFLGVG